MSEQSNFNPEKMGTVGSSIEDRLTDFVEQGKKSVNPQDRTRTREKLLNGIQSGVVRREFLENLVLEDSPDIGELVRVLSNEDMVNILIPTEQKTIARTTDANIDEKDGQRKEETLKPVVIQIDETILPSDDLAGFEIVPGSRKFQEKRLIHRNALLQQILTQQEIRSDEYVTIRGKNGQKMMRKESYIMYLIPKLDKMVFVCDEEGNATFVLNGLSETPQIYQSMKKSQLKELSDLGIITIVQWKNEQRWSEEMLIALTTETGIAKISDFSHEAIADKVAAVQQKFNKHEKKSFLIFEEARNLVRQAKFQSHEEYMKRYREFPGIPSTPEVIYKNFGWNGWPDFLGYEPRYLSWERAMPFAEAKKLVQKAEIAEQKDYYKKYKEIDGLPSHPDKAYQNAGWAGWADFLGYEGKRRKNEELLSIAEATEALKRAGIDTQSKYRNQYKNIVGLPSNPDKAYRDKGWIGWPEFFGQERTIFHQELYLPFEEARTAARSLGISKQEDYYKVRDKIPGLPSNPRKMYTGKGWIGFPDFLGYERKRGRDLVLDFEKAKKAAQ